MNEFAESEAIFGSASRSDGDLLSDRDFLLVDDDTLLLKHRQAMLEADGWSVASYTFNKLMALSKKGALFIQHLKDEALISRDINNRLQSALDTFQPKNSYGAELLENKRLAELICHRPNTRAGALWAADVLYVTTRNFGILYLAQKKKFHFSYSKILEALAEDGIIDRSSVPDLLKLRFAKSLYRSGERIDAVTATTIVQKAIDALPTEYFPKRSIAVSPQKILLSAKPLCDGSPPYHRLRNLERTYIALQSMRPSVTTTENLATLLSWIENPRAYALVAASNELQLIGNMRNLIELNSDRREVLNR